MDARLISQWIMLSSVSVLRLSQAKTLAWIIAGIVRVRQLNLSNHAQQTQSKTPIKHNVKPLECGRAATIVRQLAETLDYAHGNPVPVSLARAIGADILIAVDLSSDILGRHLRPATSSDAPGSDIGDWMRRLQDNLGVPVQPQPRDAPRCRRSTMC